MVLTLIVKIYWIRRALKIGLKKDSNTHATVAVPLVAGIWDYKGADPSVYVDSTKAWRFPSIIKSGGGDFQVRINSNSTGGKLQVTLRESDGGTSQIVGAPTEISSDGKILTWRNLNRYLDGGNGAEFFITVKSSSGKGYVTAAYYD